MRVRKLTASTVASPFARLLADRDIASWDLFGAHVGRVFFSATAAVSAVMALCYGLLPLELEPRWGRWLVATCLVQCGLLLLAWRLLGRQPLRRLGQWAGWSLLMSLSMSAVATGEGLHALSLGSLGLLICMVTLLAGWRASAPLVVAALAVVLALAAAQQRGWLPAVHAHPNGSVVLSVATHGLLIALGWAAGALLLRVFQRARVEVERREQRFLSLLNLAADLYWEQDAEFRFTHMTDAVQRAAKFDLSSRLGLRPWELPDIGVTEAAMAQHRADLLAHRKFAGLLTRRVDLLGRQRIFNISGEPRFDDSGVFCGYWGVGRDVTEEVLAQEAQRASEMRYQELFAHSPSPLVVHQNARAVHANEAAARMFGFADAAAMVGHDMLALVAPGPHRERARQRVLQIEQSPEGDSLPIHDFQMLTVQGQPLAVQASAVRVNTARGLATLAIFFDITERQATEAALRRSQATLAQLFASSPNPIMLADAATGRYTMVNDAFCRLLGYGEAQVIGRTGDELGLWHHPQGLERRVALLPEEGEVMDQAATMVTRAGALLSTQVTAKRFVMEQRSYVVVNVRDVTATERTRLEHEAILQRASIGIAFTRAGRFVQVNPRFEDMFGWPPGSLPGQPGSVIWLGDADYEEVGRIARPLLSAGQPAEFEREVRRRDGTGFWCRLLAQVVDRSDPSAGGTVWIAEDITERRRTEQALATARDAAEAANHAKSAFLANTSHEIRTPLNGLLGMARLAMEAGLDEARRQACLQQVFDSAQSLSAIISDILDLSKVEAGKLTLETLPFGLRDTLRSVHRAYLALAEAKGLELTLDIAHSVPDTVTGDPVRVRQILSNFVTNAVKFTERGRVGIEAINVGDGRVRLAVRDTGVGIDEDTLARLFVPFSQGDQSITRRFGGTGLGLSICRELAHLMKGRVGAESSPGQGSRFWADLPLPSTDSVGRAPDTEAEDLRQLCGARVLLAEDNPVNMMIGVAMLESWGVQVTQAVDGALAVQAVERAASAGRPFDLVLMDVQMPQMSGYAAARVLRERHDPAALPIVALTAAALVSEREEALAAGMNDFLTKPIDAARLRHTLATHLGAMAND